MAKKTTLEISSNFKNAAHELAELAYSQPLVERPDDEPWFVEANIIEYDVHHVIGLLSQDAPSFFGHKEATYAGLASWIVSPSSEMIRIDFISRSITSSLAKAEEKAQEDESLSTLEQDIIARYFLAGPQFMEQLYSAICGMSLVSEHGSLDAISEYKSVDVYTMVKMMIFCHFLAENPALGIQPSVNRAVTMLGKLNDTNIASRTGIYEEWSDAKTSIALKYAASSIRINNGGTLLDCFVQGDLDYEKQKRHLPILFGRAKYVCEKVLSIMPDEGLYDGNFGPLQGVCSVKIPPPVLPASELTEMYKHAMFRKCQPELQAITDAWKGEKQ